MLDGEALDQFDDVASLSGCELNKGSQETQALDRFDCRNREPVMHLRNRPGISHREPLTENSDGFSQQA